MRLGRVTVQTTESEADGVGSAWIGVLTKGQSGDRDKVRMRWIRSAKERHGRFGWHCDKFRVQRRLLRPSRPCTPCPVRSPPSACLQKLFVMLPSATLRSTFSSSCYNTQTTQRWPKQPKQRLVVSKHRRTNVKLILIQEQPFLLALALRAVKHLQESTSTNLLPARRPPRNPQTTSPEHTMLASRKRRSRSP